MGLADMETDDQTTAGLITQSSLDSRIREVLTYIPGFPDQRYNFPDITPLLECHPQLFRDTVDELLRRTQDWLYDTVLCVESFGYVFGIPLAYKCGCRIALMRRPGKLPRPVLQQSYSMCYDAERCMEIHKDALLPGSRVLVVDDFLISGGTIAAALELIAKANAEAAGVACVVENTSWGPRAALKKYDVPIITLATIP
jgi:adenine phosphoribosyltransferase